MLYTGDLDGAIVVGEVGLGDVVGASGRGDADEVVASNAAAAVEGLAVDIDADSSSQPA
jgi:hypothetical protein